MISISISKKKQYLRSVLKKKRKEIFLNNGAIFAEIISNHFYSWFKNQKNIYSLAFYYPINTEVDPFPIIHLLKKKSLKHCLPVICKLNAPLIFREWKKDTKLINSNFGAKIPSTGIEIIPDLILVPLLAYDDNGSRLGYGGGFYDRTLYNFRKNFKKKIIAVGLAYSSQKYNGLLPLEKTDEKLDAILTERGFNFFDNNKLS